MDNIVTVKTPLLIIRYEATGVIFERALGGADITTEAIAEALKALGVFIKEEDEESDFPVEAEQSYWDYMVSKVAEEFESESEEDEDEEFGVGDLVRYVGDEIEYDLVGRVANINSQGSILVKFYDWDLGHDGDLGNGSTSYWWVDPDQIEVI